MPDQAIKSPPYNLRASRHTTAGSSLSIATLIMMGSVMLSRIIGLFREMVFAKYSGTSFEMDAYVTAFMIPDMLNHFLAGGFLSITFICLLSLNFLISSIDKSLDFLYVCGS